MPRLRSARLAAALAGGVAALAGGAAAAVALAQPSSNPSVSFAGVTVTAQVPPVALRSDGRGTYTMRVGISNSGTATQVLLSLYGHPWAHARGTVGGPLAFGSPTVTPPGVLRPVPPPPLPQPLPWSCVRGVGYDALSVRVALPAQSSTTLSVPVTALVPSLPGTNYAPGISWSVPSDSGGSQILSVPVAPLTMGGPSGVRIAVTAHPKVAIAGHRLRFTGTTHPVVRRRRVTVIVRWYPGFNVVHQVFKRHVRTSRRGRFKVAGFVPRKTGFYQVITQIDRPGRGLMADSACAPVLYAHPRT